MYMFKTSKFFLTLCTVFLIVLTFCDTTCAVNNTVTSDNNDIGFYTPSVGTATYKNATGLAAIGRRTKNVIFFIGDGMGVGQAGHLSARSNSSNPPESYHLSQRTSTAAQK